MDELTEEQKKWVAEQEELRKEEAETAKKKSKEEDPGFETSTIFHGTELYDYQVSSSRSSSSPLSLLRAPCLP